MRLTGIDESFGEDPLLPLVADVAEEGEVAVHVVADDEDSSRLLPALQRVCTTRVVLDVGQLIHLGAWQTG